MTSLRASAFNRTVVASPMSGSKTDEVFVETAVPGWPGSGGTPPPPLIIVHGAGFITPWMTNEPNTPNFCRLTHELAKFFTVYVADLGGDWWGSPDHTARIEDARLWLNANMGTSGAVTLVGFSMGGLGALNYAKANPSNVRALSLIFPVIDLALFRATQVGGPAAIDPCYSGGYTDVTYGAAHNPKVWAAGLSSSVPVKIHYSSTDTAIPPATITQFQTDRPSTQISMVGTNGHTDATVGDALASVVSFAIVTA